MPTYTYRCTTCNRQTELSHGMNDTTMHSCPACGGQLQRCITGGSGFIVKGGSGAASGGAASSGIPCGRTSTCCGRDTVCDTRSCP